MPPQLVAQSPPILNTEATLTPHDFEQAVLELVADGIELWRRSGFNSYDDKEQNYTTRLETCMNNVPSNHSFIITREMPDPTEAMRRGDDDSRKEPRIDIAVHSFSKKHKFFSVECKRLGKEPLIRHYVNEGINRFVTGKYARHDKAGAMVGYVIEGRTEALINAINEKINRHQAMGEAHRLIPTNPIRQLQTVYKSNHTRQAPYPHIRLTHFLICVPQSN